METKNHNNSTLIFVAAETTISPMEELRERIKIEFYKSYDVMTGIRIAATLGGFFSMMILLVLYKNYCKPSKTLSEEQLNAAVTAAAEEEDRALQAALEATSFYTSLEKKRKSLENANQVLLSPRFSSVGGGYSHLTPPLKASVLQQRGKSLPGSVLQFGSSRSSSLHKKKGENDFLNPDEDLDLIRHPPDFSPFKNYLNILPSRRVSSVTCSSVDSAYLDRRLSGIEMGTNRFSREKLLEKKDDQWDYFYPIDIQVIQPTPEMSPSGSEKNLGEDHTVSGLQVPDINDRMHRLSVTSFDMSLAPLASISSLGGYSQSSSLQSKSFKASFNSPADNQTCTCGDDSLGSDSVFMDEIDEFETDSEFEYDGFDDDYSFCETKERPISRTEMRTLQFASFDSYDASIAQDSVAELTEEETLKQSEEKQSVNVRICPRENSTFLKRVPSLFEGTKVRKKLVKTYSEPRTNRVQKQLLPWIEKGRSGYIPKRQLSSPSKKMKFLESPQETKPNELETKAVEEQVHNTPEGKNPKEVSKFSIPSSSNISHSFSATGTPHVQKSDSIATSMPKQGFKNDLPLQKTHQLSLPNTQEKRSRLQKQKNIMEDIKPIKTDVQQLTGTTESFNFPPFSGGGLLKPPNTILSGSTQHLAKPSISEELEVPAVQISITLPGSISKSSEKFSTSQ